MFHCFVFTKELNIIQHVQVNNSHTFDKFAVDLSSIFSTALKKTTKFLFFPFHNCSSKTVDGKEKESFKVCEAIFCHALALELCFLCKQELKKV